MLDQHHVVPKASGGWDVRRSRAERASVHCATKREAINRARDISRNQGTELIVHNLDGRITNPDSHGHDPCPPRDRR